MKSGCLKSLRGTLLVDNIDVIVLPVLLVNGTLLFCMLLFLLLLLLLRLHRLSTGAISH